MSSQKQDLIQRHWQFIVLAMVLMAALLMLFVQRPSFQMLIVALATALTGWNVRAYATGQRFHVAPGVWAQADDSLSLRRWVLAISLLLDLCFVGLFIYSEQR